MTFRGRTNEVSTMRDLFGQLAEGVTVDEYLEDFPTAGREQIVRGI